jgi:hypothetical protein
VDIGSTQLLRGYIFAGCRFDERGTAEKNRAGTLHDDRLVRHRGDVCTTRRTGAHDDGDLRDTEGGHPRLVVEDPAKVIAVRKNFGLQRQKRAARVDQIDARKAILESNLLRPYMLLDGHGVIRAAFDSGIVGHDQNLSPRNSTDASDETCAGGLVVIHVECGKR